MISTTEIKLKALSTPSKVSPYYVIDRREPFFYDPLDKSTPASKDVIIGSAGKRFKRLASPLESQVTELQAAVKELQPIEETPLFGFDIIHDMMKNVAKNIQDIGVKPSNGAALNSDNIEKYLASIPEGATPSIYIPYGEYHFARQIHIHRKPVYLFGDSGTIFGNSTKLIFPPGIQGMLIDRGGASIQESIIERLCVISTGKTVLLDGIAIRARVKMRDVTVKGFSNNGFGIWSNMDDGNDSSGSLIQSCHSLENGNDGFFVGRTDANAVLVVNCDARDNGRHGFNEDSFLGNTYDTCMAHYNKQGDFHVRDWGNAQSLFRNCYSEGGSPPSSLGPLSTVIGGMWGSPYTIGGGAPRHGSFMREYEQVK